jgi:hypothetical protein
MAKGGVSETPDVPTSIAVLRAAEIHELLDMAWKKGDYKKCAIELWHCH